MKYVTFTPEEKAACFDQISSKFYQQNFGMASKVELELLMFHLYLDKLINENKSEDGTINYSKCSDYLIAKELGITQQKVRNLKIKKQLVYPLAFDWKKSLATLTENARYDTVSHKITINIPDPNLFYELDNYIEETGGYVEMQLNPKILQIRVEYYIALLISMEDGATQKTIVRELKKKVKETTKTEAVFDDQNIANSLITTGVNLTTIAANITTLVSGASAISSLWGALTTLLQK